MQRQLAEPKGTSAAPPVFLHTGWRSGGTWLWSQCRGMAGVRGFYEPLHEAAAHLRRSDIDRIGPDSWQSGHGDTAPYFDEYRSLIPKGGRGVALYQPRFAFDSFFLGADDPDPELEAYISALLAVTGAYDEVGILKFCRSLGRVAWFERHFPTALHAVVVRSPLAQWQSGQRLLLRERNRYFTVAPALVMARNAHHPLFQQACCAMGVRLPALDSTDMAYGVETIWRVLRRQSVVERYRVFLAYWTTTMITALQGQAMVINSDHLSADAGHRAAVEAALQTRLGCRPALAARPPARDEIAGPSPAELHAAHEAATALAMTQAATLTPGRLATVLRLLECRSEPEGAARTTSTVAAVLSASPAGAPRRRTGWLNGLRIGVEVMYARALQPLRRLHGQLSSRRRSRRGAS